MSDVAIRVEGLGKVYRIGAQRVAYGSLRESLTQAIQVPLRNATSLLRGQSRENSEAGQTIWALKDVSFEIKQGEAIGVIGRNGAGKSTLLKILSRITQPTEGYAEIRGRIGSLLEVGTGFHPELTGRENIYLSGAILGMRKSEIQRRFDEIVAFAEIDKFIDTPVKHYSSGMYVRLAFAVAAHLEPEVLMVDEVLAVGDLQFQKKCLGKMQSVSQTGRTVLFVSHNMSAITRLCSTAISLDGGRLLESGPACDVVSHYLASTMGTPGAAIWTDPGSSPGTNEFRLAAVRLVDGAGMAVNVTNIEQPLDLQIDYLVLKPGLRFRCTASFNTGGTCAFSTLEPTEILRQGSGRYRSTVRIPGNLLAEGEYTVGISIFASRAKKMHYCKVDDVVVFQVYDPVSGSSARGDYAEGLSGVTRPLLSWHTEYLR